MTQEELAEKTELSARTIQRIENGEVDPRAYTLQAIAKALEVDFGIFMDQEQAPPHQESTEQNSSKQDPPKPNPQDDHIWLALIHLSALFLLLLPSILLWNYKKDQVQDITTHYKDVLRFQLTCWFLLIFPGIFLQSKTVMLLGIVLSGTLTLLNTVRVLNGIPYNYILMIRFKDKNGKFKLTFK